MKWISLAVISLVFVASCGGGGGSGSVSTSTGTLSVSMTDATTTDYDAVYVTIREVAVHKEGDPEGQWTAISSLGAGRTYNLLALVNGALRQLAIDTLPAGHYTQLRLILTDNPDNSMNIRGAAHPYGNYIIDNTGSSHELKVPSGFQSGIKLVKGFDIAAGQAAELILDFDATRSIVKAGSSGQWLLKPTIKVLGTTEYAVIEGTAGEPGVLVSAQVYDPSQPLEDRVAIETSTVSEGAGGDYRMYVRAGSYTVVGYKEDRLPYYAADKIIAAVGTPVTVDFTLDPATTGTVTGTIDILDAEPEQYYATISIRQDATVSGNSEQIEIKSLNVADGGTIGPVYLPYGSYTAVISAPDKTAVSQSFNVTAVPYDLSTSF